MKKITLPISTSIAAVLVVCTLTACGGGSSGDVVAQVGTARLTRSALNYWLPRVLAGDYVQETGETVPTGLVSDPPRNSTCVANIEAGIASSVQGRLRPTSAQLFSKCQRLNRLIKEQTLNYMINWQVSFAIYASQGVRISDAEVKQHFVSAQYELFQRPGALQHYLAKRRWSLKDELFLVKVDLLAERFRKHFGENVSTNAFVKFYNEEAKRWKAKTICHAGYVVENCKGYRAHPEPRDAPSPGTISEEISKLRTGAVTLESQGGANSAG